MHIRNGDCSFGCFLITSKGKEFSPYNPARGCPVLRVPLNRGIHFQD